MKALWQFFGLSDDDQGGDEEQPEEAPVAPRATVIGPGVSIKGELRGDGDGMVFESPAVRLELKGGEAASPRAVTLGVRPEHVRLTRESTGGRATVNLLEPLGDETLVFLDYGGAGSLVAKVDATGPAAFLTDNNSTAFFAALGDLLVPGPTYTNVNDFRAIVVDRP